MKIKAIRATPVNLPLEAPYLWAHGLFPGFSKTIVEVDTVDGITDGLLTLLQEAIGGAGGDAELGGTQAGNAVSNLERSSNTGGELEGTSRAVGGAGGDYGALAVEGGAGGSASASIFLANDTAESLHATAEAIGGEGGSSDGGGGGSLGWPLVWLLAGAAVLGRRRNA